MIRSAMIRQFAVSALASVGFLYAAQSSAVQAPVLSPDTQAAAHNQLIGVDSAGVRTIRPVTGTTPKAMTAAYAAFRKAAPGSWVAQWDADTGAAHRIWGRGIDAPKSNADADAAVAFARNFMIAHHALVAPKTGASSFIVSSNHNFKGTRTVRFDQYLVGRQVKGASVSFRFKNDRMIAFASTAIDVSRAVINEIQLADGKLQQAAEVFTINELGIKDYRVETIGKNIVLPLIGKGGIIGLHDVTAIVVRSDAPISQWSLYVDTATGRVVAFQQTLHFATGGVNFHVPERYPLGGYIDFPAAFVSLQTPSTTVSTDGSGSVSFADGSPLDGTLRPRGLYARVENQGGATIQTPVSINSGASVLWDESGSTLADAQLTSFIHTNIAKSFARTIAPDMTWVNSVLPVRTNHNDVCNAFYDGQSINFYRSNQQCGNTGQLADVVHHEFGHGFHHHSVSLGAGDFEAALSEGVSDYYAATISNDPAMGRGFFNTAAPLRHIDPNGSEAAWPDDIAGDPHTTGLIIGGALWDLRKILVSDLGAQAGADLTDSLFSQALRNASDIPSMYTEMLVADDDDGDLENGTPHVCAISAAFGAHGLRNINASTDKLDLQAPTAAGYDVSVAVEGLFAQCATDAVENVSLRWRTRRAPTIINDVPMSGGPVDYIGTIEPQDAGEVIEYQVDIGLLAGGSYLFPDNAADPFYQMFVGEIVPLYCTDFETDPFAEGWTHGLEQGSPDEGADDWTWGTPFGDNLSGDPSSAYSGNNVIGNDLGGGNYNGLYQSNKLNFAESPEIDLQGYKNVHVQYYRWLNVEDGYFDRARIAANGEEVWTNHASATESASTHHADKEWRFHDVELSGVLATDTNVKVRFEIESDGGLEMGGWTIDNFCVVALSGEQPGAVCGNGTVEIGETCDDGNTDSGDGCDSSCNTEQDQTTSSGSGSTGSGNNGDGPTVIEGCACTTAGGNNGSGNSSLGWLAALGGAAMVAARRRRRS